MKEICPKCGLWYSTSLMRDKSKVFICEDCCRKDLARMTKKKYTPVYGRLGFATVIA